MNVCTHELHEIDTAAHWDGLCPLCLQAESERQHKQIDDAEAEIERLTAAEEQLRASAKEDAAEIERLQKQIGELQFVLNELLLCEIDDAAETIVRRALEQK